MPGKTSSPITGVILAGGRSRRMGGGDKGLLELGGRPMLDHVVERLGAQVDRLIINSNTNPERFARWRLSVVPDTLAGFLGPLAGVLAGMRWSRAHAPAARCIVTAAGDAPLLPHDLVAQLSGAADRHPGAVALAQSFGELHPVIGIWPVALADDLEAQLLSGVRKVLDWTDRHGTLAVAFAPLRLNGLEVDPFFNANTPQELERPRALIAEGDIPKDVPRDMPKDMP